MSAGEAPPEFVSQVTEALRLLYDPSGLARSPLGAVLLPPDLSAERRARSLRTLLLETIESLNPGPKVPFRSLAARSYQALHLHYVQGHTVEDVGHLLALSLRQAYRDVRKGEADLAALLWQNRRPAVKAPEPPPVAGPAGAIRQEVERLPLRPSLVSLRGVLEQAAGPLEPLANRSGVVLSLQLCEDHLIRTDADALRQCLTALLSCAVQACEPGSGRVTATTAATPAEAAVSLCLTSRPPRTQSSRGLTQLLSVAQALAAALGGARVDSAGDDRETRWWLRLPVGNPDVVMVIDDNAGLPELFRRYLSETDYTVVGVQSPAEGLALVQQRPPWAIVLDIIMPGTDGWALLAQLKADPTTASVPVIVCSVFDDPELASSLGAAACLSKPVSQAALVGTLDTLQRGKASGG